MLFGVGVSCHILYSIVSYLYVSYSESITSVGEERAIFFLLSFTCNYVVSVRRGFLFLLVLGMGCVILLWHSLCLPYNYYTQNFHFKCYVKRFRCLLLSYCKYRYFISLLYGLQDCTQDGSRYLEYPSNFTQILR